jgi:hypothetical protein
MSEDIRQMIDKVNNLNQNLGGKIWFHGSKRDKINFGDRDDNPEYNMMGYGLYLTDNITEAGFYATQNNDSGFIYHITVNGNFLDYEKPIEKNIKQNILNNDPNFYSGFKSDKPNLSFDTNEYEYNDYSISWDYLDNDQDWATKGYFISDDTNNEILSQGLSKDECFSELQNIISKLPATDKKELEMLDLPVYKVGKDDVITKDNIFDNMFYLLNYLYIKLGSLKLVSKYLVQNGVSGVISKINTSDYSDGSTVCAVYDETKYKINKKEKFTKKLAY